MNVNAKAKMISTNDGCEICDGFLVFEVRDEFLDDNYNKTYAGVWTCAYCERATIGIVVRNLKIKAAAGS
jgi:hypothetical protein